MSPADTIEAVKLELTEIRKLGSLSDKAYASAMSYVSSHGDEIVEMAEYSSISEVVDTVTSVCAVGGCG